MLNKELETRFTILPDGRMEVCGITKIMEDGVELSRSNHRFVLEVGQDTAGMDEVLIDAAKGVHTPARIAAREKVIRDEKAAREAAEQANENENP